MKTIVCKIGTSSLTDDHGIIRREMVAKICDEVAALSRRGDRVAIVTSGAIAAGLPEMGYRDGARPKDMATLQAISAVGQTSLIGSYKAELGRHGLAAGQVLLAPFDFMVRSQYLHARTTLAKLLDLGAIPVINENDAVADDEIRFGDNDRIAALVAQIVDASVLVLLTDTPGLFTADPRTNADASLIEEIVHGDHELQAEVGGAGTERGSGGMASKLAAARMASWGGIRTVIADAFRDDVVRAAADGESGVGTTFQPRAKRLPARKLWIAFAQAPAGTLTVDDGARRALSDRPVSLLPAGLTAVSGTFEVGDAVEIVGADGVVFAKGLCRYSAADLRFVIGKQTSELSNADSHEVVHRDDLVIL